MTARLLAFAIWAVTAATAVFWGLRVFVASPQVPAHAQPADGAALPPADLSRVLGQEPVIVEAAPLAPEMASRFQLVGVAAPRAADRPGGVALIAVDGKPARAYRVGTAIEAGLVLQSVHARGAQLGPRGEAPQVRLELPPLPPPNTGTLPVEDYGATTLPSVPMPPSGMPPAGLPPMPPPAATFRPPPMTGAPVGQPPARMPVPVQPVPAQPVQPAQEAPEGQTN